ncbi:hypothetical protein ACTMTF_43105 [Nonomuraea sp. ZG12]
MNTATEAAIIAKVQAGQSVLAALNQREDQQQCSAGGEDRAGQIEPNF